MKKLSALIFPVFALAVASSGCAKDKGTPEQQQAGVLALISQSLQLPAPDNSYSVASAGTVRVVGTNAQALVNNIFNPIAVGLKEMNSHLAQTVAEGDRSNGGLTITHNGLGTKFSGVRDETRGTVAWTYTLPAGTYFTGTGVAAGTSGDFTFPAFPAISAAFSVHYDIVTDSTGVVKHVTVIHPTGNLAFTLTFTNSTTIPSKVALTGSVSGIAIKGDWTAAAGGSFKDVTGVTKCFSATFADAVCPP